MEHAAVLVAEEVWRVTTPLAGRPRTVHAYLARLPGGGWMLVDGGVDSPAAWAALLAGIRAAGADPGALVIHVVTHMHRDHLGLAGRIREVAAAPLAMGAPDAERAAHAASHPEEEAAYRAGLLREHGAPATFVAGLEARLAVAPAPVRHTPVDFPIGDEPAPLPRAPEWIAVATPGHTAGHRSLLREADGLLIGGDVVLPRVSPTIGVNRHSADPVADHLGSLARLRALAPRRILPGHGDPIDQPDTRLAEAEAETRAEIGRVQALLRPEPCTAWDLAAARYTGRELPPEPRMQALRETLAHLQHLVTAGAAGSDRERGVVRFWPL